MNIVRGLVHCKINWSIFYLHLGILLTQLLGLLLQLFLNWKPRTQLAFLKPNLQADVEKKLNRRKEQSDKLRGSPGQLQNGEKVLVKTVRQENIPWVPGKILEKKGRVIFVVIVLGGIRR